MARHRYWASALVVILPHALAGCCATGPTHFAPTRVDVCAPRKCTILIPLAYNDGTGVPADVLARIEDRLYEQFGGYTFAGTVAGAYRMADGSRADDRSIQLWVVVAPYRMPELRRAIADIARELGQESMYLEVSGAAVDLVRASAE